MGREAILEQLEAIGLGDRFTPLERAAGELLVTWLTPLLRAYETPDQLLDAGAESIADEPPEQTTSRLKGHGELIGERICAFWPWDATAVEMNLADFADHFDDLWYPGAENVWLLSLRSPTFVVIDHEELVLAVDVGGPTRWPVFRPRPRT